VAGRRPDLLRRLVLAEPGGDLDAMLSPAGAASVPSVAARIQAAAEKVGNGDIDGALTLFFDMIDGDGASLVIHASPDDYMTDPSGNSGARIACAKLFLPEREN
jgi:Cu/Zn superoxide dismutase